MDRNRILEIVTSHDRPRLHACSEEDAQQLGMDAGPIDWGIFPEVIRYMAQVIAPHHHTIETGGGHSTIALAALGAHHICINPDEYGVARIQEFMRTLDIPEDQVEFVVESSDTALARLTFAVPLDFALIDGLHGFPFAMIDWHYIDLNMRVGGVIAVDDFRIPAVAVLCDFLEKNGTHQLLDRIRETAFYRKTAEDESREWNHQKFNADSIRENQRLYKIAPIVRGVQRRVRKVFTGK